MKKKRHFLIALALALTPTVLYAQSFADMVGSNPNYVLGADPIADTTAHNSYVGTCKFFYFQDGCDVFVPIGFEADTQLWGSPGTGLETTPRLGHAFKAGTYSSLFLPSQYVFGDNDLTSYILTGITFDTTTPGIPRGEATMISGKMGGVISDHVPYFIYATSDMQVSVSNASYSINPTPYQKVGYGGDGKITSVGALASYATNMFSTNPTYTPTDNKYNTTWRMYGTTEHIDNATAATWGVYGLSGNEFHPVVPSRPTGYLSPLRAFIAPDAPVLGSAKPTLAIMFKNADGGTTDINGVSVDDDVSAPIYTMDGKYVGTTMDCLPRGIYVVKGKKVIK